MRAGAAQIETRSCAGVHGRRHHLAPKSQQSRGSHDDETIVLVLPARLAQLAALLDGLADRLMDVACSIRRQLKVESALRP
jgi:hypothetical protein